MSAIRSIQEKLGRMSLKSAQKKFNRKVRAFNIEQASSIAIIYNATNRSDADLVKKLVHFLKEERKEVLALGYINTKDSSELVKPHLNYSYFDKKDLNKSLIPKGSTIDNFIQKPFSILIDLNYKPCFPIEYITTLSRAKFKVGASGGYRDEACDLTIDIHQNKSLEFLIIQIRHYLQMIHN
ncbi:MAG: hypothetical protein KDD41_03875 [Flavobacteriales bacterium]|nr:hypothetical protein [Flavobacteriales bacterium]